jgi:predicted choloylglycine hydrolase
LANLPVDVGEIEIANQHSFIWTQNLDHCHAHRRPCEAIQGFCPNHFRELKHQFRDCNREPAYFSEIDVNLLKNRIGLFKQNFSEKWMGLVASLLDLYFKLCPQVWTAELAGLISGDWKICFAFRTS